MWAGAKIKGELLKMKFFISTVSAVGILASFSLASMRSDFGMMAGGILFMMSSIAISSQIARK